MMKTKTAIEFFDNNCSDYDYYMKKSGHYLAQERLLKLLWKEIDEPVLDLACGTGVILSLLSQKFSQLSANDLSKAMLGFTEKRLVGKKISYSNDDAEILNSCSKKFKTIVCCNLFYYIKDYDPAITRWRELLEDNGKLIIMEEYPFIIQNNFNELNKIVNSKEPTEILKIIERNHLELVKEKKVKIDLKHNLYGFVFVK